jgi:hypothetical protein
MAKMLSLAVISAVILLGDLWFEERARLLRHKFKIAWRSGTRKT